MNGPQRWLLVPAFVSTLGVGLVLPWSFGAAEEGPDIGAAHIGSSDMTTSGIEAADYIEHKSSVSFQLTVDRLVAAIEKAGMSVFATIDHAAGAKAVGMSLPPTVVLIYGQARGGTPVMQADPAAALDLPLRVLIRQDTKGETLIAFHPIQETLAHYKVPHELAERLAKAQQLLVNSI
jgi:uncharacterized protein (DUF302 family)